MLVSRTTPASVDRIDIVQPSGSVTTHPGERTLDAHVALCARRPTRARSIEAISRGRTLRLKTLVSSNPAKQQMFQLDSTATLVRIYVKGMEAAAFRIGKPGPSYTETYVRREGSNDVYLTDGMLAGGLREAAARLAEQGDPRTQSRRISVRSASSTETRPSHSARPTARGKVDGEPATEYAVRGFLASLASLQCDDFVDTTLTAGSSAARDHWKSDGTQIGFHQKPGDSDVDSSSHPTERRSIRCMRGGGNRC